MICGCKTNRVRECNPIDSLIWNLSEITSEDLRRFNAFSRISTEEVAKSFGDSGALKDESHPCLNFNSRSFFPILFIYLSLTDTLPIIRLITLATRCDLPSGIMHCRLVGKNYLNNLEDNLEASKNFSVKSAELEELKRWH